MKAIVRDRYGTPEVLELQEVEPPAVADDSVLVREGIVRLLERSGVEVIAQAGDYDDLLRKARGLVEQNDRAPL
jgi:hypothetical protein